jgi:hypothetical protein
MHKRSERIAEHFETPLLAAAALTIPATILQLLPTPDPRRTIADVLNWVIWLAFVTELVVMLAVVPSECGWLRGHPLEVAIVDLTPPFLAMVAAGSVVRSALHGRSLAAATGPLGLGLAVGGVARSVASGRSVAPPTSRPTAHRSSMPWRPRAWRSTPTLRARLLDAQQLVQQEQRARGAADAGVEGGARPPGEGGHSGRRRAPGRRRGHAQAAAAHRAPQGKRRGDGQAGAGVGLSEHAKSTYPGRHRGRMRVTCHASTT